MERLVGAAGEIGPGEGAESAGRGRLEQAAKTFLLGGRERGEGRADLGVVVGVGVVPDARDQVYGYGSGVPAHRAAHVHENGGTSQPEYLRGPAATTEAGTLACVDFRSV